MLRGREALALDQLQSGPIFVGKGLPYMLKSVHLPRKEPWVGLDKLSTTTITMLRTGAETDHKDSRNAKQRSS